MKLIIEFRFIYYAKLRSDIYLCTAFSPKRYQSYLESLLALTVIPSHFVGPES